MPSLIDEVNYRPCQGFFTSFRASDVSCQDPKKLLRLGGWDPRPIECVSGIQPRSKCCNFELKVEREGDHERIGRGGRIEDEGGEVQCT